MPVKPFKERVASFVIVNIVVGIIVAVDVVNIVVLWLFAMVLFFLLSVVVLNTHEHTLTAFFISRVAILELK